MEDNRILTDEVHYLMCEDLFSFRRARKIQG